MDLAKTTVLDRVEIVGEFKHLQVRYETKVTSGNETVATSYKRESYPPNTLVRNLPEHLKPYASVAWTSDVVFAYEAHLKNH